MGGEAGEARQGWEGKAEETTGPRHVVLCVGCYCFLLLLLLYYSHGGRRRRKRKRKRSAAPSFLFCFSSSSSNISSDGWSIHGWGRGQGHLFLCL